jgi:opacity protein-like surface antigen
MKKLLIALSSLCMTFSTQYLLAQDILDESESSVKSPITNTFNDSRLVIGHSVNTTPKGVLDIKIAHRFGRLDGGLKDFFGLDNAVNRLSADYGLTDRLQIGVGRSSYSKEIDAYLKGRILTQETNGFPFTVTVVTGMSVLSGPILVNNPDNDIFVNRLNYHTQLLLARKFNRRLSLQLMPTFLHYNMVYTTQDHNSNWALGIGGKYKITQRLTLDAEYYYQIRGLSISSNVFSIGLDIETGGHVFQLHVTNSYGITERAYIGQTGGQWKDGAIHFGFNISRVFTVQKPKGMEQTRNKIW